MSDSKLVQFFEKHGIVPLASSATQWRKSMIDGALEIHARGPDEYENVRMSAIGNFIAIGTMPLFEVRPISLFSIFSETPVSEILDLIKRKISEECVKRFCLKVDDNFVVSDQELHDCLQSVTICILVQTEGKTNPVLVKNMLRNYLAQQIFLFTLRNLSNPLAKNSMMFDVWSEGYAATGQSSRAIYHGKYEGIDFKDAVANFTKTLDAKTQSYINLETDPPRFWGCRFFDNEIDARKFCG